MERIYCKSIVRVQCLVDSEASSRDEKKNVHAGLSKNG